jgi:TPP-dependent pyruvate/acetoin dehydrogenase alpha subunit
MVNARQAIRDEISKLDSSVRAAVAEAVDFALSSPFPEPAEALKDIYAR